VKFAFLHELVHVHQIKNGLTFEEYFATAYSDNQYEKEANEVALVLLDKIFGVNESILDTFSMKLKLK
jgi:Zn-dependent peptidase ImmA (M78 family)